MRWIVVAVGRLKETHYRDGVAEYLGRIARSRPISLFEIPEDDGSGGRERDAMRREAERIRQASGRARIVALTEHGNTLSTVAFASRLEALETQGGDLAFVLGGPNGLDPDLERDAAWRLSLSPMTLPYQLARLVLLEQLYRADSIRRGEPYHRGLVRK